MRPHDRLPARSTRRSSSTRHSMSSLHGINSPNGDDLLRRSPCSGRSGSNNVPYSGFGFGYNAASGGARRQGSATSRLTLALVPRDPANFKPPGGSNPDYTAPTIKIPCWPSRAGANGAVTVPIPFLAPRRPDRLLEQAKRQLDREPLAPDHVPAHRRELRRGKPRPPQLHRQQSQLQSDVGRGHGGCEGNGTSTTTATAFPTACGSIWAFPSRTRPTAGPTSRCSPSSAWTWTAG